MYFYSITLIFVTPNLSTNMIEGKGRFVNRPTRTDAKIYDKFCIHVPTKVATDSLFPFKPSEEVTILIDIDEKRLVITKRPRSRPPTTKV